MELSAISNGLHQLSDVAQEVAWLSTLRKKRNATNLTVVIFSILLIGLRVFGYSFIRHVIDMIGVFIQAEQRLFNALSLGLVLAIVSQL